MVTPIIYRAGLRYNIPRLKLIRYSVYETYMADGTQLDKHRYAFEQEGTNIKFVYTGRMQAMREGSTYDIRGTIKQETDKFGFIRLSRIRKVQLDPELPL